MNALQIVSDRRSKASNACFTWLNDKVLGRERYAGFTEEETRFYIGCCVLGLEAMHKKGVLHRSVGPTQHGASTALCLELWHLMRNVTAAVALSGT